jgi:hypothetical protein
MTMIWTLDWKPGRWWRVVAPDDGVRCETSDLDEAIASMRPGDLLQNLWQRREQEWREVDVSEAKGSR